MAIKRLKVSNFRSFGEIDVELGNLSVIVGANASGKSNFVRVFEFLRDIHESGMRDAVSVQGGMNWIPSLKYPSRPTKVEYWADQAIPLEQKRHYSHMLLLSRSATKPDFVIEDETVELNKTRLYTRADALKIESYRSILEGEVRCKDSNGHFDGRTGFIFPYTDIAMIYDIDPRLSKLAVPIEGKWALSRNGENLVVVLNRILEDKEQRRTLVNLTRWVLPYIKDVSVQDYAGRFLLHMTESYGSEPIPAAFLSDGTIYVVAMIVALHFTESPLVILEEPDRHLHPSLIAGLMQLVQEVSERKQVIITTHNPDVVKHTPLESLYLISRDKDGFSVISQPKDKIGVQTFLESELGIDDLHRMDLLDR
ncbi:MAG: AAA family ATPase [Candidatus Poribacteria bacterium]|nr:AAA family ATPase [Candidatus Poribacteria bacterium]